MPSESRFKQDDIIESAFRIVRQFGWEGLSARSIAEELGSSTMPIYSSLKSMNSLEEEVVKRSFILMREYMHTERTNDQWLDFGLGYVLFAKEERNLFRCLHQERYIHLHEKFCFPQYQKNYQTLLKSPSFQAMSPDEQHWLAYTRYAFVYGIASLINVGLLSLSDMEIESYLRDIQMTLRNGMGHTKNYKYAYMGAVRKRNSAMGKDE